MDNQNVNEETKQETPVTTNTPEPTPVEQTTITSDTKKENKGNPKGLIPFAILLIIGMGAFIYLETINTDDVISNTPTPTSTPENKPEDEKTKMDTLKATAASIINGVKQQLTLANRVEAGDYYVSSKILERGNITSPLGGKIVYRNMTDCEDKIGNYICKSNESLMCSDQDTSSYVHVEEENGVFKYSICLSAGAGNKYINLGEEKDLLDSSNYSMIK